MNVDGLMHIPNMGHKLGSLAEGGQLLGVHAVALVSCCISVFANPLQLGGAM